MRKSLLGNIFQRSSKVNPIHPRDPALASMFNLGGPSPSGITVTEESAVTITAVYAAVNIIAETIAMLPLNLFERKTDGTKHLALNDPRFTLLHDQPNRYQDSFQWREMVLGQLLLRGRSVCEIIMNKRGVITDLLPLQPDTFSPFWAPDGTVAFTHHPTGGERRILLADEVLDLRGHPNPSNPIECISPIMANAGTLGISQAAEDYSGSFFGNGTVVSGVLQTDNDLSEGAYQRLKEWTERHQGVGRSHNPAILEEGLKWQQTSVNAEDAQLIETRKFQISEVARMYRIPGYKIGAMDDVKFNTVEQQSIDFAVDTLSPRISRLENVIERALFLPNERNKFTTEINLNGLLRGDTKSRGEWYQKMWNMGAFSANMILQLENMNPVEGGDRHYVPVNYVPTDKVDSVDTGKPFIRSIFDRIITAQVRIIERCGGVNEASMAIQLEKHKKFIDRNIEPIVKVHGEDVRKWFSEYYLECLRDFEWHVKEETLIAEIASDMRDFKVDLDCDKFLKWLGDKDNA